MPEPSTPPTDERGVRTRSARPRWLVPAAGLLAVAVVAAGVWIALGGEEDSGGDPAVIAQEDPSGAASALAEDSPSDATVVTAAPRDDGLTGAPLPQVEAQSAEFDESLLSQGVGRFPPLDDPTIVTADQASWMTDDTLVLGAIQNGEARAYPIAMMRYHHISNDVLGGEPYLVTF